jgi:dipeptide/tripeptide permease
MGGVVIFFPIFVAIVYLVTVYLFFYLCFEDLMTSWYRWWNRMVNVHIMLNDFSSVNSEQTDRVNLLTNAYEILLRQAKY